MGVMKAVCVLKCRLGHSHGVVNLQEVPSGTKISVHIQGLSTGLHGFHVHRRGDEREGSHSLCSHYNPTGQSHGALNSPYAHAGDFGNIYSDSFQVVDTTFIAKFVTLTGKHPILGRSLVVHSDEDDLGRGHSLESKTTGNSGTRLLWGIIGVDDDLPC